MIEYSAAGEDTDPVSLLRLRIKRNAPPRVPPRVKIRGTTQYAGVVELADTLDLGDFTSVKVLN